MAITPAETANRAIKRNAENFFILALCWFYGMRYFKKMFYKVITRACWADKPL